LESIQATKSDLQFTIKDAFTFLGVEMKTHSDGTDKFLQKGSIEKILKSCNMTKCNMKSTPFDCSFDYALIVGMMMYDLSSNSRPDIQFAVHQCAQFTLFIFMFMMFDIIQHIDFNGSPAMIPPKGNRCTRLTKTEFALKIHKM
jgi:hypothetical protein